MKKNNIIPEPKLIYTKSAQPLILEALGLSVNGRGYLVKRGNKKPVYQNGKRIKASEIIGFCKGKIYTSIFELADDLKK